MEKRNKIAQTQVLDLRNSTNELLNNPVEMNQDECNQNKQEVTFHCIEFNLDYCLISISSILIKAEILQDEVGAQEVEPTEDHVELNQGERNQEELQGIAIAEEVSIDNFALIVI